MRILYMGTPDFAVPPLRALAADGHEIIGCITREDAPKGRKMILTPPPVKTAALAMGIPVFQPHTLRGDDFALLLRQLDPDLIAVVAYGRILPKNVLDYPPFGCINVHGSLLPEYRGAAPIQRAVMDGKKETGITTMYMDEGMDTGDMLLTRRCPIGKNETCGELTEKLSGIGAALLTETVRLAAEGKLVRIPQDSSRATLAPKIGKEEEMLDFSLPADTLHNRIRALSPSPMCRAYLPGGSLIKIAASYLPGGSINAPCGTVCCSDGQLSVACGGGSLLGISELVPEGKQKMNASDYLRGRKLADGDLLRGGKD
ncbi:MAG: methionyl-tRNA formyltransferase [Eubacteriales bacterium]|nr:methionyl-tRNA formyltransferase [Eubacteriales bacterium]